MSTTVTHSTEHAESRAVDSKIIVELVRAYPGHTSAELAKITEKDRFAIARRLPDAAGLKKPRVYKGAPRPCTVTGRNATTWWPIAVPVSA